jgi:hypothetical protein
MGIVCVCVCVCVGVVYSHSHHYFCNNLIVVARVLFLTSSRHILEGE